MVFPFGISVGDFISGIELVATIIAALKDSTGSSAEYSELVRELENLEAALKQVRDLGVGSDFQKAALRKAAAECNQTISSFLSRILKYQPSLQPGGSLKKWKDALRKVQWSLYTKKDVRRFRAELQGHTAAIQIMLMQVMLGSTIATNNATASTLIRLEAKVDYQKTIQAIILKSLARCWTEFQSLMTIIMFSNLQIYEALLGLLSPRQVEFDQPVTFEDAHGRLFPVPVQWIDSWEDFDTILKLKFKSVPGLRKIENREYVLQDAYLHTDLDRRNPFQTYFRPGRRVTMRMVFDAGFGRSDDARYLPERKEAECNAPLVQGNLILQPLSRIFYFSRFRVLDRNLELLNLGGTETGMISLFNSVLKECGRRAVGWMTGYIQPPEVKYLQAPPHVRLHPLESVTTTFYIDGELY